MPGLASSIPCDFIYASPDDSRVAGIVRAVQLVSFPFHPFFQCVVASDSEPIFAFHSAIPRPGSLTKVSASLRSRVNALLGVSIWLNIGCHQAHTCVPVSKRSVGRTIGFPSMEGVGFSL